MYSKFENFMKKYLAPLADKMDKEVIVDFLCCILACRTICPTGWKQLRSDNLNSGDA